MAEVVPPLQVNVFLSNGKRLRFVDSDPASPERLFAQISPERAFHESPLTVAGNEWPSFLASIRPEHVARIEVLSSMQPEWALPSQVLSAEVISEQEFQSDYKPGDPAGTGPDGTVVVFAVVLCADGAEVILRLHARARTPLEQKQVPTLLTHAPFFWARMPGRGVLLFNTAHILASVYYPGTPEITNRAWHLERRLP